MRMVVFYLFFPIFITTAFAQSNSLQFMTSRDILSPNLSASNVYLQNNQATAVTVYGLYVLQYAYVNPGQTCASATVIYPASNNITAGAYVMPTSIGAGKKSMIGSNYLYNMIYQAIYYENIIIPSSPPGCALPGCTWGADSSQYQWCIYLGALAPVSTGVAYTANVPPSTYLASDSGLYNYNLITAPTYIGPLSCNDRTLACVTETQQTQAFS